MKAVTINIADPLYAQLEEQARQANRQPSEVINEALNRYFEADNQGSVGRSVLDIKSFPLGPPVAPWSNRGEILEGFMDDRG